MFRYQSLRLSLLAAIGALGCAGSKQGTADSSGDGAVVSITPISSNAPPVLPDPTEPKRVWQTGWVKEADGTVHRATATKCESAKMDDKACRGDEKSLQCKVDSDCTAGAHGVCRTGMGMGGSYCGCFYSCETDAECGAGKVCVCAGVGGLSGGRSVCAPANCVTDANCPGSQCGLSVNFNGCGNDVRLACRSDADQCRVAADCKKNNDFGGVACVAMPGTNDEVSWRCHVGICVPGRALRVEGVARIAVPKTRPDWSADFVMDVGVYSPATLLAAARFYTTMAAYEHASVASFSRLSLQLLALSAPSSLVREASASALDEIEHARLGYAIASVFSGKTIGPDKLPEATAALSMGMEDFIAALVFEGCVGETLSAAEVREASERADDDSLRAVLSRIADDEERHAAFSWRILAWALSVTGERGKEIAHDSFVAAFSHYTLDQQSDDTSLEVVGILSTRSMSLIRRDIFRNVIAPCALHLGFMEFEIEA